MFRLGRADAGLFGVSVSPVPAATYSGLLLLPKITIPPSAVSNPALLKHEPYILGFEKTARKIKLMNSLKGGVLGLALGFLSYIVLH